MEKRLRKKKQLGECVEWGVPVAVARKKKDDFIEQAIEGNGCYGAKRGSEESI
jgi:uncharacterized protein YggL (DUF469 family)